jgi:antitoxin (DNA-binding transcriptional repressor) of toxin-antitoxin stability system
VLLEVTLHSIDLEGTRSVVATNVAVLAVRRPALNPKGAREVVRGETIIMTRGGRRIAVLSPAPASNGAALLELVREWGTVDDPTFEDDLAAIRAAVTVGEDPWRA